MPYCEVTTSVAVDAALEEKLNRELYRIVECIPGKTENWIMTRVVPEAHMTFGGSSESACMIRLEVFGTVSDDVADTLTREFCAAVGPLLGIPSDRIYITYVPRAQWGWNGMNF